MLAEIQRLDSLINHKVEQSVFSAEVAPYSWDLFLLTLLKTTS